MWVIETEGGEVIECAEQLKAYNLFITHCLKKKKLDPITLIFHLDEDGTILNNFNKSEIKKKEKELFKEIGKLEWEKKFEVKNG